MSIRFNNFINKKRNFMNNYYLKELLVYLVMLICLLLVIY
jgi:hypothetical protein